MTVEQGSSTPDDFRTLLRKRRGKAWISAVVGRSVDGAAPLLHALIVVGSRPDGWTEQTWNYGECSFTAIAVSTARLASILDPERDVGLQMGSISVEVEMGGGAFNWLRKPSLALYDELVLPWPSLAYTISLVNQGSIQVPSGYLVGQGNAPSFPNFASAYNAFYLHNFAVSGANNPQLGQLSIRLADARARIGRVRIRPASLEVWVGGHSVRGTTLELNGTEYRAAVDLTKASRVPIALPTGLPRDTWLWLKQGSEWRDFRALSWEGSQIRNVEVDVPRDPGAELSALIAQGEGLHLEYKEKLPDSRDEKRHVFKTVVAFANGNGGTMLFGIGDGGELRGIADKLPEARRRLSDLLRDLVDPPPPVHIEAHRLEGKNVLVLEVSSGDGVLHAVTLDKNRPEYYVRRDGTTFFARPNEVTAVVQQASTSSSVPWFGQ